VIAKIRYQIPRLPGAGGVKLIPDPRSVPAEKQNLEAQGFVVVEIISPPPRDDGNRQR
jgi:hypothetical protein